MRMLPDVNNTLRTEQLPLINSRPFLKWINAPLTPPSTATRSRSTGICLSNEKSPEMNESWKERSTFIISYHITSFTISPASLFFSFFGLSSPPYSDPSIALPLSIAVPTIVSLRTHRLAVLVLVLVSVSLSRSRSRSLNA